MTKAGWEPSDFQTGAWDKGDAPKASPQAVQNAPQFIPNMGDDRGDSITWNMAVKIAYEMPHDMKSMYAQEIFGEPVTGALQKTDIIAAHIYKTCKTKPDVNNLPF